MSYIFIGIGRGYLTKLVYAAHCIFEKQPICIHLGKGEDLAISGVACLLEDVC